MAGESGTGSGGLSPVCTLLLSVPLRQQHSARLWPQTRPHRGSSAATPSPFFTRAPASQNLRILKTTVVCPLPHPSGDSPAPPAVTSVLPPRPFPLAALHSNLIHSLNSICPSEVSRVISDFLTVPWLKQMLRRQLCRHWLAALLYCREVSECAPACFNSSFNIHHSCFNSRALTYVHLKQTLGCTHFDQELLQCAILKDRNSCRMP